MEQDPLLDPESNRKRRQTVGACDPALVLTVVRRQLTPVFS